MGFGIWEILLIVGVVVLLFGARRLPMLGKALGETAKEFKTAFKDNEIDVTEASRQAQLKKDKDKV